MLPVAAIGAGVKGFQLLKSLSGTRAGDTVKRTIAKTVAKAEQKRVEKAEIAQVNQSQIIGNGDINYLKTSSSSPSGSTMQPDTGKSIGLLIVAGVIAWLIFK